MYLYKEYLDILTNSNQSFSLHFKSNYNLKNRLNLATNCYHEKVGRIREENVFDVPCCVDFVTFVSRNVLLQVKRDNDEIVILATRLLVWIVLQ